jgi:hypothetical protein
MAEQGLSVASGTVDLRPTTEQRAWVRFPNSQEVWCQSIAILKPNESQTGWFGRLSNLSAGGVALRMNRCFSPGALLVIEFEGNREPRSCAVQVAHATEEDNGYWKIGCKFLSPLNEAQVRALLGV